MDEAQKAAARRPTLRSSVPSLNTTTHASRPKYEMMDVRSVLPTVLIPYRAHATSEAAAREPLTLPHSSRPLTVLFHGNVDRRDSHGVRSYVRVLLGAMKKRAWNISLRDVELTSHGQTGTPAAEAAEAMRASTRAAGQSRLCLVPRGDTQTSRRLYDVLAAGCVPVIVTETVRACRPNLRRARAAAGRCRRRAG